MTTPLLPIDERTRLLLDDPAALANHSWHRWQHLTRADVDAMQLAGLKARFAALRDRVPVLKKLADAEGIEHIDELDDVVPLLFEHTVYKSYPPSLLDKSNFTQINRWLAKLVTSDIAEAILAADVSQCRGIDDWLATMDETVPQLCISHTSGTSGTFSFLPHGTREWQKLLQIRRMAVWNMDGPDTPQPELHAVYPYFRTGFYSYLRSNRHLIRTLLPGESHFHAAYPEALSSDVVHLAAKARVAHAKGTLDRFEIRPEMLAKKQAFDRLQADMPRHLAAFFERMASELKGKRVYMSATWNLLHNMAKAGLARGLEGVFEPGSFLSTSGGAKGIVQPEGWREDVLRFTGAKRLNETYSMSEVVASHTRCEHGHYHFSPTAIPFVLDAETSRPLPRTGRVTGRAAFFDLGADSRWGGFITGDEITVEWDKTCPCGQPGAYVLGPIQRYSEKHGGDDKITCAASESSHREAMDYLNRAQN